MYSLKTTQMLLEEAVLAANKHVATRVKNIFGGGPEWTPTFEEAKQRVKEAYENSHTEYLQAWELVNSYLSVVSKSMVKSVNDLSADKNHPDFKYDLLAQIMHDGHVSIWLTVEEDQKLKLIKELRLNWGGVKVPTPLDLSFALQSLQLRINACKHYDTPEGEEHILKREQFRKEHQKTSELLDAWHNDPTDANAVELLKQIDLTRAHLLY